MKLHKYQSAFVMPSIVITATFLMTIALIITDLAVSNVRIATDDRGRLRAQLAADSGLDYGVAALNNNTSWPGTSGEVDLLATADYRTTYEVTATMVDSRSITLSSIGRTYQPATATTPTHQREFIAEMRGIGSPSGSYSIVTGVGGLFMENSAKIVAGEVFVNGEISMQNSAQIGLTTSPVNVEAAHFNCPIGGGASYPMQCTTSDGEPISISNIARIYGDVCARNQFDGTSMQDGGLDPTCSGSQPSAPTPQPLPDHDRAAQIAAISNTITGDYVCDSNTAQWILPANTRITGNFDIQKKCKITLLGDVWVEGNLTMINSAQVIVSDTLGTTRPNIMVDGSGGAFLNNSSRIIGNAQDTGAQLITYWSTASCAPGCADVTGTDLYDSRNLVTVSLQESADAENSILYARWSQAELDNGGDIGAIIGQTVRLRNSASVTFGAAVGAGSGTGQVWLIDSYRRNQ